MSLRWSIRSHGRADTVADRTVATLLAGGVDGDDVDLWATPDQIDDYRAAADHLVHVRPGGYGLDGQLRAMRDHYDDGQPVVYLDDDLTGVYRLAGDDLELVDDLPALATEAFGLCAPVGASMWGIYPVPNPYFMSVRARVGLWFCIGQLQGAYNRKAEDYTLPDKDDYERSLRRWEADGAVVRLEDVCVRAGRIRKNPGGMQDLDRMRLNHESVDYLLARWPDVVVEKASRDDGYREIRLRAPSGG